MIAPIKLTRALGGSWHGASGLAFCPAHENHRTPALSIGVGSSGNLLLHCFAGCPFPAILSALKALGLFERQAGAVQATRSSVETVPRQDNGDLARRLWRGAQPIGGTLAEAYLRSRAIAVALPSTLRFDPRCYHGPTRAHLPAMLAEVSVGDRQVGLHRTYLAPPGRKAEVKQQRAMLGPCKGGGVTLSDGPGPLVVADGVETALSVLDMLVLRSPRMIAGLSNNGIESLILPDSPGDLVIAPDGEPAGRRAAEKLARRADRLGWSVDLIEPPSGGRDWNDLAEEAER